VTAGLAETAARAAALERVRAAADRLCRYRFACWHYGDSIGFDGLLAAADVLGDHRYEGFVHGAVKSWIPRAEPYRELDNTAPGHAMCLLYERTGDEAVLEACVRLAGFLTGRRTIGGAYVAFERAPLRAPYGGAALSPAEQALLEDPGAGVFVDCLHFDAPFLVHLGRLTDDEHLVQAGVAQALALVGLLQQPDGLFAHFFLERTEQTYGHGWGRGQGWALLGLLDVLEQLPDGWPVEVALHTALARLAAGLAATQEPDGHWPTPVSDRTSFHETSTAAFAAAGLARGVALRLLDRSLSSTAERAWRASLASVATDGSMAGVSAALWASTAPSHYAAAPVGFQVPWGAGPFLVAAREHIDEPSGGDPGPDLAPA
jgi:unsaturated rhamnogalacturonyl hydrolase